MRVRGIFKIHVIATLPMQQVFSSAKTVFRMQGVYTSKAGADEGGAISGVTPLRSYWNGSADSPAPLPSRRTGAGVMCAGTFSQSSTVGTVYASKTLSAAR